MENQVNQEREGAIQSGLLAEIEGNREGRILDSVDNEARDLLLFSICSRLERIAQALEKIVAHGLP